MDPKKPEGDAISDSGGQAGLACRNARSRIRQGRQSLGGRDVPRRHRAKFDKKTEKFQFLGRRPKSGNPPDGGQLGISPSMAPAAPGQTRCGSRMSDVGNILSARSHLHKFENLGNFKDPQTAEAIGPTAHVDGAQQRLSARFFGAVISSRSMPKPKNTTVLPDPPDSARAGAAARSRSRSRRLWFCRISGQRPIGMFDPETERMTEWKVPTPWSAPYDALLDRRNGDAVGPGRC